MTDHLEAAIQAGADALSAHFERLSEPIQDAEVAITAALPYLRLHFTKDRKVRKAIIQSLANKAERELAQTPSGRAKDRKANTMRWLRVQVRECNQ